MNKQSLINLFSILTVIVLLIIIGTLFSQKQNLEYTILYQYQATPDIDLTNTLNEAQGGIFGEVRGFVKFNDLEDQPKTARQYYIIKPLNKFDKELRQYFLLETIIKLDHLPPTSIGISELVEENKNSRAITLEDENGNQFFIDRGTKKVSIRDITGDDTTLITSNQDFGIFIKGWVKR